MKNRKQMRRMLRKAFQTAGADKVIGAYLIWFFGSAVPIWLLEPQINSYGDALWFCFASATSIGYGDYAAVTFAGRLITVALSVYSIGVIAVFTASSSARRFLDELEHLPELSKEELEALSERVKEFNKH